MTQSGERYDSTRKAWEEIWDDASIESELEAARYPRSRATIEAYLPYLDKSDLPSRSRQRFERHRHPPARLGLRCARFGLRRECPARVAAL